MTEVYVSFCFRFSKYYGNECSRLNHHNNSLHEKYPNTEFFWSVFSGLRTEYGEIRSISPHSVRRLENRDQKKLCIWRTLFTQWLLKSAIFFSQVVLYYFASIYSQRVSMQNYVFWRNNETNVKIWKAASLENTITVHHLIVTAFTCSQ